MSVKCAYRRLAFALLLLCCGFAHGGSPAVDVDFTRDIQPILADNCYACHGHDGGKRKADLRLDALDPKLGPFVPRDGYSILVPGKPDESVLILRITSDDPEFHMPPPESRKHLSDQQIDLIKRWVEQGAKWSKHWSLIAPQRPAVPQISDPKWIRNPIDALVLARLDREGLTHAPEAPKETLIRRVTLDLTGLPPTPEEVDTFLADQSPDAYAKLVDRLLACPRYGERMVWEWLDLARYADTNGYQFDATRSMWPWRDWVVNALNNNMPFDQFVTKQLAGDMLSGAGRDDKIATAFLRNHMINGEGGRIAEENRVEYIMDQTETVSTALLGLTVGCARCHDHKFDPISQKDYYSLFAFFNNTPVTGGDGSAQAKPIVEISTPEQSKKLQQLQAVVNEKAQIVRGMENELFPHSTTQTAGASAKAAELSGNLIEALKQPPETRLLVYQNELINYFKDREPKYADAERQLVKATDERDKFSNTIPRVMVMEEQPEPRETFVLVKGSYDKPADKVAARTLETLPPIPDDLKKDRLALAKWLFSPEHPLTARVAVNRWWQQFFGVGIVKTADDFGIQGERPGNPELLDWLAVEFRESGWNIKALHRLIVTSSTYRQSSKVTPELYERDPENRLLARGPRFRLPACVIRDQALAASGLLVEKIGGPPVKGYQPPGVWEEATFGQIKYEQEHGEALYRRSLYTFWRRIVGPTEFFDSATRQTCTVRQRRTNTPLIALTMLNDVTFVEAARGLAQRVMLARATSEDRLNLAFRLVLARKPRLEEQNILLSALERMKSQYANDKPAALKLLAVGESKADESLDPVEHAAYAAMCLEILNLDEALTKE
jgi:hypothetical protein